MDGGLLDNIRIVLVATTHPGNIGAAARAMKTMGVRRLALVDTDVFPSADATARASGADDILAQAQQFPALDQALADCGLVYATSGRRRNISWPALTPAQAAAQIRELGTAGPVAVVFGRESSGLTNDELESCHAVIRIPTDAAFPSLNIAAAVQIICYELRVALAGDANMGQAAADRAPLADAEQMGRFYDTLLAWITEIGYFDPERPRLLMRRMKRLFNRARLDANEYNILMGIIAAARKAGTKKGPE